MKAYDLGFEMGTEKSALSPLAQAGIGGGIGAGLGGLGGYLMSDDKEEGGSPGRNALLGALAGGAVGTGAGALSSIKPGAGGRLDSLSAALQSWIDQQKQPDLIAPPAAPAASSPPVPTRAGT